MPVDQLELCLIKNGEAFRFRYSPGGEGVIFNEILDTVEANDGFDDFDAAALLSQIHFSREVVEYALEVRRQIRAM